MTEPADFYGPPNGVDPSVTSPGPLLSPRLGASLALSIHRARRRCEGEEKPIPVALEVLADHFGGGLWPGLHMINSGTGVGKTQLALAQALHSAQRDIPVLYIGLELGQLEIDLRVLGLESGVPWSSLWTGSAGTAYLDRSVAAMSALEGIPFHYEIARPMGFSAIEIKLAIETLRAHYPETGGPGSRPILIVVDFLQIVGDTPGDEQELRIRIGRAAYALRDAANRLGACVLCVSSINREKYRTLAVIHEAAGLAFEEDEDGCPLERRILDPDAIVGMGKESGEIEFSADSVSVIARVSATWSGSGCDVVFATAKGRATGAMWSPLHFSGFAYSECQDRGGRIVQAWKDAAEKREIVREERKAKKEIKKEAKRIADAAAIARYVLEHDGCSVTAARVNAVNDNSRRWKTAVAVLGAGLTTATDGNGKNARLSIDRASLPPNVAAELGAP